MSKDIFLTTLNENLKQSTVEILQPDLYAVCEFDPATADVTQDFAKLTLRQLVMTGVLSQGSTLTQAGKELRMTKKEAHREKESIQSQIRVPNMAAVVHLAVASQVIRIKEDRAFDSYGDIDDFDVFTLGLYAEGVSNDKLSEAIDRTPKWCMGYEKELFKKVGAWTRPHAIRRGYEIGLLAISSADISSADTK